MFKWKKIVWCSEKDQSFYFFVFVAEPFEDKHCLSLSTSYSI